MKEDECLNKIFKIVLIILILIIIFDIWQNIRNNRHKKMKERMLQGNLYVVNKLNIKLD